MLAGNLYHIFIKNFYGLSSVCCLQINFIFQGHYVLYLCTYILVTSVFVKTNWDLKCSTILSMYCP